MYNHNTCEIDFIKKMYITYHETTKINWTEYLDTGSHFNNDFCAKTKKQSISH